MQLRRWSIAGSGAELGVLKQYFDSELHLVDDALSIGLVSRPKFEIGKGVVQAVTVFVMHAFHICQRATEVFRHRITMFQNFSAASKVQAHVSRRVNVPVRIDWTPRATLPSAFFAAEFLALVVARMFSVQRLHEAPFFRSATQLALKSRGWLFVHIEQLFGPFAIVNGVA